MELSPFESLSSYKKLYICVLIVMYSLPGNFYIFCKWSDFLRNIMKLKMLKSRNLMPFFIFSYLYRENKTPPNTVWPKLQIEVPAKLSTKKVHGRVRE